MYTCVHEYIIYCIKCEFLRNECRLFRNVIANSYIANSGSRFYDQTVIKFNNLNIYFKLGKLKCKENSKSGLTDGFEQQNFGLQSQGQQLLLFFQFTVCYIHCP